MLAGTGPCPVCGLPVHTFDRPPAAPYSYLLGVYLGDGYLTPHGGSWSLRITLDKAYPGFIEECRATIEALRGRTPAATPSRRDGSVVVASTWKAWSCLFPQHGPGKKGKTYEYPRYQFSNRSDDIRNIFTNACDALGIEWRSWTRYHVSVAKRSAVARLDAFVGPKTQSRRDRTPTARQTPHRAAAPHRDRPAAHPPRSGATMLAWTNSPSTPFPPRGTSLSRWKPFRGSTASA